jgi:hypothetical protein
MSLLTMIAEARALVATGLSDSDLQVAIDREESWLAHIVGALSGERTQTLWVRSTDLDDRLLLQRPTGSVEVTDGDTALDASAVRLLSGGTIIEKATGPWTGPSVAVTYTPDDEGEIKRVLIDLVRMTITSTPFVSEQAGSYSYQRGGDSAVRSIDAARRRLAADSRRQAHQPDTRQCGRHDEWRFSQLLAGLPDQVCHQDPDCRQERQGTGEHEPGRDPAQSASFGHLLGYGLGRPHHAARPQATPDRDAR